jgi:hypothetical protein
MKKIRPSYPRRKEMLQTPFEPLSEDEFRKYVASGVAIPGRQGSDLFVSKWRDGPGLDVDAFLAGIRAQGSRMVVRKFHSDVNIRVLRGPAASAPAAAPKKKTAG